MKREVLSDCLKRNFRLFVLYVVLSAVNAIIFLLYRSLNEGFFYALVVGFSVCFVFFVTDYFRTLHRIRDLNSACEAVLSDPFALPAASTAAEKAFRNAEERVAHENETLRRDFGERWQEMRDYYTVWVHQIKTPIAVMKLNISPEQSELSAQLFRMEESVQQALTYQRLGSPETDLVFREYELDTLIRDVIRKYAPQFISKKTRLIFEPTGMRVVTDSKWMQCVLEQLISNAVKYTAEGMVKISARENSFSVSDTGVGIAAEDLPRIFDQGYTGINGRHGEASSGLGLYLCKKAADLLRLTVTAESTPGRGSCFTVTFPKR